MWMPIKLPMCSDSFLKCFQIQTVSHFSLPIDYYSTRFSRNHLLTLRCHIPVEFEYQLSKLQDDDAFQVSPLSGTVPANGKAKIFITYHPLSYCTSTMKLQLEVSQFNSKPLICTITGYCQPGVNAM